LPAGKNVCYGLFIAETLYAVAVYGIGSCSRVYGALARETGLPVEPNNTYELKRLVRRGERDNRLVSLSQMLSLCHKMLRKEEGIQYICSYSDPQFNPHGGIYAASNFTLIGWTNNHNWQIIDDKGISSNRRALNHWRNAHGNPTVDGACEMLGYKKVRCPPKKRWFIALDPKDQKILKERFPPQPKRDWLDELEADLTK
jgi:hypothetical protein